MNLNSDYLTPGILLAAAALLGTGLMTALNVHTRPYIEANKARMLNEQLQNVLPAHSGGQSPGDDAVILPNNSEFGTQSLTAYRVRKNGQPAAAALKVIAPNGYSGPIDLLVGVDHRGHITGVRVLSHKETPGLGDAIDIKRSQWIRQFDGKHLQHPPPEQWAIKKDGGDYDQITGASVTSRAVVDAIKQTLAYFHANRQLIFSDKGAKSNHAISSNR